MVEWRYVTTWMIRLRQSDGDGLQRRPGYGAPATALLSLTVGSLLLVEKKYLLLSV